MKSNYFIRTTHELNFIISKYNFLIKIRKLSVVSYLAKIYFFNFFSGCTKFAFCVLKLTKNAYKDFYIVNGELSSLLESNPD